MLRHLMIKWRGSKRELQIDKTRGLMSIFWALEQNLTIHLLLDIDTYLNGFKKNTSVLSCKVVDLSKAIHCTFHDYVSDDAKGLQGTIQHCDCFDIGMYLNQT